MNLSRGFLYGIDRVVLSIDEDIQLRKTVSLVQELEKVVMAQILTSLNICASSTSVRSIFRMSSCRS